MFYGAQNHIFSHTATDLYDLPPSSGLRYPTTGGDIYDVTSVSSTAASRYLPMFGGVKPVIIDPTVPLDRQE